MAISYEWCLNKMDGVDIVDIDHHDITSEGTRKCLQLLTDGYELELSIIIGNDDEGITDRFYVAYDDGLPTHHNGDYGYKIPTKIHGYIEKFK